MVGIFFFGSLALAQTEADIVFTNGKIIQSIIKYLLRKLWRSKTENSWKWVQTRILNNLSVNGPA